jgi:hypothetical protein
LKLKNYTKFTGYFLIVVCIALLFVPSSNIKNVKRQPTSNVESNTNEGGVRISVSNRTLEVQPIPLPKPNVPIKIKPL